MAYHNNTPKNILNAPKSMPIVVHENTGANRAERRHTPVGSILHALKKRITIHPMLTSENKPFKKDKK